MRHFSGFDETTGECLASCGGWASDGHTANCELGKAAAELADLRAIKAAMQDETVHLTTHLERARLAMEEYQEYRRMNTLNFQLEKADSYIAAIAAALERKL